MRYSTLCSRSRSLAIGVTAVALVFVLGCGGGGGGSGGTPDLEFQPLEFPFATPSDVVSLSAFGIPNWSGTEPHNGTDLVISETGTAARIVSPTAGRVQDIRSSENPFSHPPGQLLLTIAIRVNAEWEVNLVIEPGTVDAGVKAAQQAAVAVTVGQDVAVGDHVVDLLVGAEGHPHLHYMIHRSGAAVCAYKHSSTTARGHFDTIALAPTSHMPDGNICYGDP